MILKFCNDNLLFYITHTKYFDILCCFVIIFLISLIFLTFNNKFIEKIKNSQFKMTSIIIFFGLFVGFLVFLFAWLLNKDTFNGCSTKYYQNIYFKMQNSLKSTIENLENSKVIIIGDSRMELINDASKIKKPFNFIFIAKSGRRISWLKSEAIPKLKAMLKNKKTNYHIIVNMGVNDLNSDYKGKEIALDYFKIYQSIAHEFSNAKIYILSVNPIDESKINKFWVGSKRTNKKIQLFNKTMQIKLKKENIDNMFYCNSYNKLKFDTYDGLHYTNKTNKDVINYIENKCIKF